MKPRARTGAASLSSLQVEIAVGHRSSSRCGRSSPGLGQDPEILHALDLAEGGFMAVSSLLREGGGWVGPTPSLSDWPGNRHLTFNNYWGTIASLP